MPIARLVYPFGALAQPTPNPIIARIAVDYGLNPCSCRLGAETLKVIKFDLPIDNVKVSTGDELRRHFTAEILDHFRNGTLARWLRTRPDMSAELDEVEKLAADGEDEPTLLALCGIFSVDATQLRRHARQLRDGLPNTGSLPPGGEDRWLLDVAARNFVHVEVFASAGVVCMLEDAHGCELATGDAIEREPVVSLATNLSQGTYYIRLRSVDGHLRRERGVEDALYDIRVSQDQGPIVAGFSVTATWRLRPWGRS